MSRIVAPMDTVRHSNTDGTDSGCAAHGPHGHELTLVRAVRGREAASVPSVLLGRNAAVLPVIRDGDILP